MNKSTALRIVLPAFVVMATFMGIQDNVVNRPAQGQLLAQASQGSQGSFSTFYSSQSVSTEHSSEGTSRSFSSESISSKHSSSTSFSQSSSSTISQSSSQRSEESSSSSQAGTSGGDFGGIDGDDSGGTTGGNGTTGTNGGVGGGTIGGTGGSGGGGIFCVGGICTPSIITYGIPGCYFEYGIINAGTCLPAFMAHLIRFVFGFAAGICILMIAFAGYEIVLGSLPGGSSEAGKNRLTWAIIGFIMAATSFFIMDFIISSIGG